MAKKTTASTPKKRAGGTGVAKTPETAEGVTTASEHSISLREVNPKVADEVEKTRKTESARAGTEKQTAPDPDFRSLRTVEELVEAYNDMVPTAVDFKVPHVGTTKSFVDVNTGQLACERLHDQIKKARDPEYKAQKEKSMAKKATKKSKTSARTAVRGQTRGKRVAVADDAKITILKKANPAREGSSRHKRWSILLASGGKTVAAYVKAKGNVDTLRGAVRKGHVKLTGGSAA